jgi:hypothetical protein
MISYEFRRHYENKFFKTTLSKEIGSNSEIVRELQKIKNEAIIANDERARGDNSITNATKSPYLTDQTFYKKDIVYNSAEETSWKNVKTSDEVSLEAQEKYLEANRRKLNII